MQFPECRVALGTAQFSTQTDESYVYDDSGNRRVANGVDYAVDRANRVVCDGTFRYTYDAEGNVKTRRRMSGSYSPSYLVEYTWDHRNRLVKVTNWDNSNPPVAKKIIDYVYDAQGRMTRRSRDLDASGTLDEHTYFVHDGTQRLIEFNDTTGLGTTGDISFQRRYLYADAVDQVLATDCANPSFLDDGPIRWGLADHEGTIRDVISSTCVQKSHYTFDSFGKPTSSTTIRTDFPLGYIGQPYDQETSLWLLGKRWYNGATGRFASEDPIPILAGDPNRYRYCGNNPMTNIDPSGLCYTGLFGALGRALGRAAEPWVGAAVGVGQVLVDAGQTALARLAPVAMAPAPENYASRQEWFDADMAHMSRLTMKQRWDLQNEGLISQGNLYWNAKPNRDALRQWQERKAQEEAELAAYVQSRAQAPSGAEEEGIGFWDWVQGGLDAGGIAEPTPFCDLTSGAISAVRGNWGDTGWSLAACIPYIGDVGKVGKYAAKVKKIANLVDATTDAGKTLGKTEDAAKAAGKVAPTRYPEGSFSVSNWSGYPQGVPRPQGPFRLVEGAEYDAARNAANAANRAIHRADPSLAGQHIHEIQPVKFGGSPTDPANKIPLPPQQHSTVANWWNRLMRSIRGD